MEKEIVSITEIADIRKSAGQSEKKIANAAQEFNRTPTSGTFSHIGTKVFTINKTDYTSVGLFLTDGTFISENTIRASDTLKELFIVANGENKGSKMLVQKRLSDLSRFGASQDAQLVALQGKSFKTTPVKGNVLIEYTKEKLFGSSVSELWKNTEPKTLYIFDIE
jgi:hypothetical protein